MDNVWCVVCTLVYQLSVENYYSSPHSTDVLGLHNLLDQLMVLVDLQHLLHHLIVLDSQVQGAQAADFIRNLIS